MGLHLGAGVKHFYKVVAAVHSCWHSSGIVGTPHPCPQLILSVPNLSHLFGFAVLFIVLLILHFPEATWA